MHFDHNMRDMLAQIVRQKIWDYDYKKKNDTYLLIIFLTEWYNQEGGTGTR